MASSTPRAQRKILVADDSSAVRHHLARLLGEAGYEVLTAANGVEVLALLGRLTNESPTCSPGRPSDESPIDMLICDAGMTILDGVQSCMLIRRCARHVNLPVVMLSSQGGLFASARSAMAGADELLCKPVNDAALLQIARAHVDGLDAV